MSLSIGIHCDGKMRVDRYYPSNANSITLEIGKEKTEITIYGLPTRVTDMLMGVLADKDTLEYKG